MYEKLNEAIILATSAHSGQLRKLSNTPYILHPLEVASIISTITTDEDVIIAGVLHDTIEDCNLDKEIIKSKFGMRVYSLVLSETEDKLSTRPASETWYERKKDSLLMLEYTKNIDVKILWLADKLSNLRSFYRESQKDSNKLWDSLNQKDPKMHHWYYQTIAQYLKELESTDAYKEYIFLIDKIFISE